MDLATDTLEFVINISIVETIISDLFFRDDEQLDKCSGNDSDDDMDATVEIDCKVAKKANQKTNAMRLFDQQDNEYIVTIKNVMRFELTMDHISISMSFQQTATMIQHTKDRTKTAKLTGMNNLIIGQYTCVLVAVTLQQIINMVDHESIWAMSLASDGSTHHGQSFFDLHICICYYSNLVNLHLVAMPMFE
ncbi:unnamed protein product [Sphagnum balticum]